MKKTMSAMLLSLLLVCALSANAFAAGRGLDYDATRTYVWGSMTIASNSTVSVSMSIYEKHTQTGASQMKSASGGLRSAKTYTQTITPHTGYNFRPNSNNYIRGSSGVTADITYTGSQIQFSN